jgi:hypothetical protein
MICSAKTKKRISVLILSILCVLLGAPYAAADGRTIQAAIAPQNIKQGSAGRVSVRCRQEPSNVSFVWAEHEFLCYQDIGDPLLFRGIVPVDMDEQQGRKAISVTAMFSDGTKESRECFFYVAKEDFPVQRLTLPESQVTLSEKNLKRYHHERGLVKKAFARGADDKIWSGGFMQPVEGRISTPFGVRRFLNGKPRSSHSGIDIAVPKGTPVAAAARGKVALTGDHFFSGNSVFIDHGMGIFTMYFHLSSIDVQPGERVDIGQTIGRAGSTGRSTGPHLHWGVRVRDQRIDPLSLISLLPASGLSRKKADGGGAS